MGLDPVLGQNINDREEAVMITLPVGIAFLGLCVLGAAVAVAIHNT